MYPPEYVAARRVLLDALEALASHLHSMVLVGAQALYMHTGASDIAVAPYTTDADVALWPEMVADSPLIEDVLVKRGFTLKAIPGIWEGSDGTTFDLLVPEALAGSGSRSADLGVHGKRAARRARGLEGALIENGPIKIEALDDEDRRAIETRVAGPAALTVAKIIKISDRVADDRIVEKDALDVLRLLRAVSLGVLGDGFALLMESELSAGVTREAVDLLPQLFGEITAPGAQMVMRSVRGIENEEEIGNSLVVLANDLHASLT